MKEYNLRLLATVSAISAMSCGMLGSQAHAQDAAGGQTPDAAAEAEFGAQDIVVKARRRGERDLEVPVAVNVLSAADIERRSITSFLDISQVTPSLVIGNSQNFGGVAAIRGIGAASTNTTAEQAVLFTLDGVSLSNGNAVRFSQFDMAGVEVLKGPQALYFGKNATAGIISVTTADPTDEFYAMARAGYEFNARALTTEAVVSGPLSDTVGARIAVFRTQQEGFFTVPDNGGKSGIFGPIASPTYSRAQHNTTGGVRGTLKFEPVDGLTIRTKLSYGWMRGASPFGLAQLFYCPVNGLPNLNNPVNQPGEQDCKVDKIAGAQAPGPSSAIVPQMPLLKDGRHYLDANQYLGSVDVAYEIGKGLTLSSLTSYYRFDDLGFGNTTIAPTNGIAVGSDQTKTDFTQELRLTSNWQSMLNFMVGGYYQKGKHDQVVQVAIFYGAFDGIGYQVKTDTKALFGELRLDLSDKLHLSAGGRYTREEKNLKAFATLSNNPRPITPSDHLISNSFSPEISIRFEPMRNVNLFASYRKGTKSGGFNTNPVAVAVTNSIYKDEKVEGVEGGIKSVLMDGQLRFDLIGYHYKFSDLQQGFFDPVSLGVITTNAASATNKGVEVSANFTPRAAPGLRLYGSLAWNSTKFGNNSFGACYTGQSIAQGCNANAVNGTFTNQNLTGKRLARAPEWSGQVGFGYDAELSDNLRLKLSTDGNYTSSILPATELAPFLRQDGIFTIGAQIALASADDKWEIALIGKNLTDELRIQNGYAVPLSPDPAGATTSTGTVSGGTPADWFGYTNDPRSIQVRVTAKF